MELSHFIAFANALEEARKHLPVTIAEIDVKDVPEHPQAIGRLMASGSTFEIHLFLSRHCCSVEKTLAVYDNDGAKFPMLIASDEEIEELCHDCLETLRNCGIELDDLDAA